MADIAAIISGIGQNLSSIPGLRVSEDFPEQVNPPVAVITLADVEYDGAFKQGVATYNFDLTVVVGRSDSRGAQRSVLAYAATDSASSIKSAVESNRTLDGLVFDLRVTQLRNIGSLTVNDTTYLAVDFNVACYAS